MPPRIPAERALEISSAILGHYQEAVTRLAVVAALGYLVSTLALMRRRDASLVMPSTVILLAVCVRFALLAVADVVATVPYAPRYYQPLFALLLLFIGLDVYPLLLLGRRTLATALTRHRGEPRRPRPGTSPPRAGAGW